jgi:arylformamidase
MEPTRLTVCTIMSPRRAAHLERWADKAILNSNQKSEPLRNIDATSDTRVSRRTLLGGLAATMAVAALRPVLAQQMETHMPPGTAPKPKGTLVFLDYDKEEIDAAYDQSLWAPNQAEVAKRNAQKSAAAVARLGPPRRLAYGPTEIEKVDVYTTRQPNAPINIFIHGGAWRAGTSAASAYLSETFVDSGAHFVAVDFNNVIETNGNLMTMADQVRRAVAWVYRNASRFGGDQNRLYVSGVSSGGHLASVVLTTDWQKDFGLPVNIVKGGLCGSGMYDLYPVTLSARSNYVKFTNEVVETLSAQRHLDRLVAPVIVAHGTLETPEFQRQSREFATAVKAAGKSVTFLVGEGYNHFELHETLGNPYGLLGRAVLEQMKLRSA